MLCVLRATQLLWQGVVMSRSDVREDASLAAEIAAESAPAWQPHVPSGLSAARGVVVALAVGSAIWAVIAVVVLAVSGRL
jgi:hypothetical protein